MSNIFLYSVEDLNALPCINLYGVHNMCTHCDLYQIVRFTECTSYYLEQSVPYTVCTVHVEICISLYSVLYCMYTFDPQSTQSASPLFDILLNKYFPAG
jgi:hypothetical protein